MFRLLVIFALWAVLALLCGAAAAWCFLLACVYALVVKTLGLVAGFMLLTVGLAWACALCAVQTADAFGRLRRGPLNGGGHV